MKNIRLFGANLHALIASLADTKGYLPSNFVGLMHLLHVYSDEGRLPLNFKVNERGEDEDFIRVDCPLTLDYSKDTHTHVKMDIEKKERDSNSIEIHDEENLGNANLESFKNILSVKALSNFMRYTRSKTNSILDSKVFLCNRDNYLLQDTFNMMEIDIVRSFREITLAPCENVYKLYIPTNALKELFIVRKNKPMRLRYPNEEMQYFNFDSVVNDTLFIDNPLFLKIRMLYDGRLSKFSSKMHKLNSKYQKRTLSNNIVLKTIYDMGERFGLGGIQFRVGDRSRTLVTTQKKMIGKVMDTASGLFKTVSYMASIPPALAKGYFSQENKKLSSLSPKLEILQKSSHEIQLEETEYEDQGKADSSHLLVGEETIRMSNVHIERKSADDSVEDEDCVMDIEEEMAAQKPKKRTFAMRETMIPESNEAMIGDWVDPSEKKGFETIMIHMHGGGFISQSSSSHQVYLRTWAKEHKIPIFSIEYRLSPQTQFPFLFNDCIRSYLWILIFIESVLKCEVKKIIVSGDSAGGNLAVSLTTWCIENMVRKPDLIHIYYPAISLDRFDFSPSFLFSVEDYFLNSSILRGSIEMYVPSSIDPGTNYYVSPGKIPDEVLNHFPPLELFLCERDPLRDDALRFALRLL